MSYIGAITNETMEKLCDIITGKEFRKLFQQQSKEFLKIRPGFRALSLSVEDALSLAKQNLDKPFILAFIDKTVETEVKKIDSSISNIDHDDVYDAALALALSRSLFSSDPELYFVLNKQLVDESRMDRIKKEIQKRTVGNSDKKTNIEQIVSLEEDLRKKESDYDELDQEYQAALKEIEGLRQEIDEAKYEIEILQQTINQTHIQAQRKELLAQYDDTHMVELAKDDSYNHISICEVEVDYSNKTWLKRLADIDKTGQIENFYCDESIPKDFDNRIRLIHMDGPAEIGFMGIWKWSATENMKNPTKDYIDEKFANDIKPIEVIIVNDCNNASELIERIRENVTIEHYPMPRIMLSYYSTHGKYTGFACGTQEIEINDNQIHLKSSVLSLPSYEYEGKDIVRLANGRIVFRSLSIGLPSDVVFVKNPMEIVKSIILKRITWPVFRDSGKNRTQYRLVKDFVSEIDTKTVIQEVVSASACTESEAENLIDQFIAHVSSYIDGATIEDSVIASVVSKNEELLKKCKEMVQDDWAKEHESNIRAANEELNSVQESVSEKKQELSRLNTDIEGARNKLQSQTKDLQEKYDALKQKIEEKEEYAKSVETAVADRIKRAHENAAEFMASMGFANAILKQNEDPLTNEKCIRFVPGVKLPDDDIETNESWDDMLGLMSFGLEDAGVKRDYARPLAAYMYSMHLNGWPLLLVGPNATAIADAYSASYCGKTAGILNCSGEVDPRVLGEMELSDDEVIRISNAFDGNWISSLAEIKHSRKHFYIITHPYIEDVQVEPKSLFLQFSPLCTELIVDKIPKDTVTVGIRSEKFIDYVSKVSKNEYKDVMKMLHTSPLLSNIMNDSVSDMFHMLDNKSPEFAYVFAFLPYAIMTMQGPAFLEYLDEAPDIGVKISKEVISTGRSITGNYDA